MIITVIVMIIIIITIIMIIMNNHQDSLLNRGRCRQVKNVHFLQTTPDPPLYLYLIFCCTISLAFNHLHFNQIAYIGVISQAHKDLVLLMLEAGKVCICTRVAKASFFKANLLKAVSKRLIKTVKRLLYVVNMMNDCFIRCIIRQYTLWYQIAITTKPLNHELKLKFAYKQ